MLDITITDWPGARQALAKEGHGFDAVVSLNSSKDKRPPDGVLDVPRYLVMHFDDITTMRGLHDYVAPVEDDVRRIIEFAQGCGKDDRVLFHCAAGVSRSTAAAYISLCAVAPLAPESALLGLVIDARATCWPNAIMVGLADQILQRKGRMFRVVQQEMKNRWGSGSGFEA